MSQNSDIVAQFTAAWAKNDIDLILSFFAPDAIYTNIPIDPPNEGLEAIRKTIEGFSGMANQIEFEVLHQTENAQGVVMNERIDHFHLKDGRVLALQVMGVFELDQGKITAWRDYFDMAAFNSQLGG